MLKYFSVSNIILVLFTIILNCVAIRVYTQKSSNNTLMYSHSQKSIGIVSPNISVVEYKPDLVSRSNINSAMTHYSAINHSANDFSASNNLSSYTTSILSFNQSSHIISNNNSNSGSSSSFSKKTNKLYIPSYHSNVLGFDKLSKSKMLQAKSEEGLAIYLGDDPGVICGEENQTLSNPIVSCYGLSLGNGIYSMLFFLIIYSLIRMLYEKRSSFMVR